MITKEAREEEQKILEKERKAYPELFQREPVIDSPEWMAHIGIENIFENLPVGYIRYLPQDFIVEEISLDRAVHTVDTGPLFREPITKGKLWQAELVKVDRSTLEARDEIAFLLGIFPGSIGWAGIKDRFALTSQIISFSNIANPQVFANLHSEHFFLKDIQKAQNPIVPGKLLGNRFIITVRTPLSITSKERKRIETEIEEIKQDGFWNFFSFQRFGTPRLNSHIAGKFLFQSDYEEAARSFITYLSPREIPYFQNIRKETERRWGDWEGIKKILEPFPSQFPSELKIIQHLCDHPHDFLGALKTIPDQIRLWVYAYASYLFNRKLSEQIKTGEVSFTLPLITSLRPRDWEIYKEFLAQDKINLPSPFWRDFPFIKPASQEWPCLQRAEIHGTKFLEKIIVMAFSLPKGAYATTFLSHFFSLASHLPILPGIDRKELDAKEVLGMGSLTTTLQRFYSVLQRLKKEREQIPNEI